MKLIYHQQLSSRQPRRVYRNESWRSLLQVTILLFGVAAFTAIPKAGGTNGVMFGLAGAIAGFFGLLTWQRWRYCARPDNWLLRDTEDGLEINLRSDQGPAGERPYPTVLQIPRQAVRGIGQTLESREMYERRGVEKHNYLCIDIEVEGLDADGIRGLLRAERRAGEAPSAIAIGGTRGFPVRVVDDRTLRLVWDRIFPNEKHALAQLQQHYPKRAARKVTAPSFANAREEERLALIAEAWEAGFVEQAIRMARVHAPMTEKQARLWLEERFEELPS